VSVSTDKELAEEPTPEGRPPETEGRGFATLLLRVGVSVVVPIAAALGLYWSGIVLLDEDSNRAVVVAAALVIGVLGVFGLYYGMDWLINRLPESYRYKVRPFAFVGPAIVVLAVFLVYPTVNTVFLSFLDA